MKNKTTYLILILFISVSLFAQNNDINLLVKNEASLKALSLFNLIPEGKEKDYGFNNRGDFFKTKIEEPYQTYYVTLHNNKLTFISGNEWRVPVSVDGKYVTLLTVQINNGKIEVVDLGGNILAQKIQEFNELYSSEASQNVIIRNTFLRHDYITTNFSLLCSQTESNGFIVINAISSEPIYQLNEAKPIKITITNFCDDTIYLINKTNENK